jgi:PAS domain S-box-containing protein
MGLSDFDFHLPPEVLEIPLLVLYALVTLVLLTRTWRDFAFGWRRLPLFGGLLVAPLLAALLRRPFFLQPVLPAPNIPNPPLAPFVSLLALPVIVAGAWFGAGPALVVGMVGGILRAGLTTRGVTDPFHFALFGFLVGFFLRQDYRGRLPFLVRQPIVAGLLAALLALPLLLVSVIVHHIGDSWASWLTVLDYALPLTGAHLAAALVETFVAATVVQLVYLSPRARPVHATYRFPPYARALNLRLLFILVPLILITTVSLLYAVTTTTLSVATAGVVEEMERNGTNTAEYITYFITIGEGQIDRFAGDDVLRQGDATALEARLRSDVESSAFFNQVVFFDRFRNPVAAYPPLPAGDPELSEQEGRLLQNALDDGARQKPTLSIVSENELVFSFLSPVGDRESGEPFGVLLGRTQLDVNPMINQVLQSLRWTDTHGEGFVVEEMGENTWRVVAHSDPEMLLTVWHKTTDPTRTYTVPEPGEAYESPHPKDNTRQLVYFLPVEGYDDWAVVIRLPYEVVLEQAAHIAAPLLLLQILAGGVVVVVILFVTSRLTLPLKQLAAAASRIAEGDLTQPVQVPGADEVARVGDAFEGMRVRLKGRMDDLSLLLQVSQAVSATLTLPEGMPFVLDGVLEATQARVVRIVLLSADGDPQMVVSRGGHREGLGTLDRALARAARDLEQPLIVENLGRARSLIDDETLTGWIKSVVAFPVRTKELVPAVMWVGYGEVRQFDASEIDLLSTLAGQTAVLVENARLFQAAEGGRRRLAAILTSTSDAVLVTDRDERILLVNPAAGQAFGVAADTVVGQKVDEARLAPALARAFREPLSPSETLTEEVPLPDGRTLYASVSAILSADGERIGRVAVMRDITSFKELDELKSEFVATVSHDLRAPLTFMRGYTTMLPMVGNLSDKQREYVEKILQGVGQMSELIDDLLDLGRIEAGVGLERKPCHLGAILVESVDGMRARAAEKGLTLRLEPAERVAMVSGDAALLRQVVTNLVDNAIKYTPSGGLVTVGLSVHDEQAVIRVADNGIGIAPDDQVRLFEKFYRVKRRDTIDVQGTGLGLAIVKSIVERHGGRVWVDSEMGKGSTFHVVLPLGGPEPLEPEAPGSI